VNERNPARRTTRQPTVRDGRLRPGPTGRQRSTGSTPAGRPRMRCWIKRSCGPQLPVLLVRAPAPSTMV